jgi:pimeloyl-ACP methyl ester carboxylesterase
MFRGIDIQKRMTKNKKDPKLMDSFVFTKHGTAAVVIAILISTLTIVFERLKSTSVSVHVDSEKESSNLDRTEMLLAERLYSNRVLSVWKDIAVGDEVWRAHYLTTRRSDAREQQLPAALLVHGYGTTATLAWRNVINPLSKDYDIFALDLPGFGRSGVSDRLLSDNTSREDALSSMCDFMDSFQQAVNISQPFVIAHSFGGFLSTHCISRNPKLASRVLLADVPGFFSTNGGFDFMWAGFFSFGLPHAVVRPFGTFGKSAIETALDVLKIDLDDIMLDYWHGLQLSEAVKSDVIVRKFIVHKYVYAIGTGVGEHAY